MSSVTIIKDAEDLICSLRDLRGCETSPAYVEFNCSTVKYRDINFQICSVETYLCLLTQQSNFHFNWLLNKLINDCKKNEAVKFFTPTYGKVYVIPTHQKDKQTLNARARAHKLSKIAHFVS